MYTIIDMYGLLYLNGYDNIYNFGVLILTDKYKNYSIPTTTKLYTTLVWIAVDRNKNYSIF